MALELNLDPNRLIADANGSLVAAKLRKARVLASAFGVIGTPTTVVGRTIVVGSITDADLKKLMTLEQSDPILPCT
jgi:protein-disulfide isomerase